MVEAEELRTTSRAELGFEHGFRSVYSIDTQTNNTKHGTADNPICLQMCGGRGSRRSNSFWWVFGWALKLIGRFNWSTDAAFRPESILHLRKYSAAVQRIRRE